MENITFVGDKNLKNGKMRLNVSKITSNQLNMFR